MSKTTTPARSAPRMPDWMEASSTSTKILTPPPRPHERMVSGDNPSSSPVAHSKPSKRLPPRSFGFAKLHSPSSLSIDRENEISYDTRLQSIQRERESRQFSPHAYRTHTYEQKPFSPRLFSDSKTYQKPIMKPPVARRLDPELLSTTFLDDPASRKVQPSTEDRYTGNIYPTLEHQISDSLHRIHQTISPTQENAPNSSDGRSPRIQTRPPRRFVDEGFLSQNARSEQSSPGGVKALMFESVNASIKYAYATLDEMKDLHVALFQCDYINGIPEYDEILAHRAERMAEASIEALALARKEYKSTLDKLRQKKASSSLKAAAESSSSSKEPKESPREVHVEEQEKDKAEVVVNASNEACAKSPKSLKPSDLIDLELPTDSLLELKKMTNVKDTEDVPDAQALPFSDPKSNSMFEDFESKMRDIRQSLEAIGKQNGIDASDSKLTKWNDTTEKSPELEKFERDMEKLLETNTPGSSITAPPATDASELKRAFNFQDIVDSTLSELPNLTAEFKAKTSDVLPEEQGASIPPMNTGSNLLKTLQERSEARDAKVRRLKAILDDVLT